MVSRPMSKKEGRLRAHKSILETKKCANCEKEIDKKWRFKICEECKDRKDWQDMVDVANAFPEI